MTLSRSSQRPAVSRHAALPISTAAGRHRGRSRGRRGLRRRRRASRRRRRGRRLEREGTRLNSSDKSISYAGFFFEKKTYTTAAYYLALQEDKHQQDTGVRCVTD